jgi:hypothetical protein
MTDRLTPAPTPGPAVNETIMIRRGGRNWARVSAGWRYLEISHHGQSIVVDLRESERLGRVVFVELDED